MKRIAVVAIIGLSALACAQTMSPKGEPTVRILNFTGGDGVLAFDPSASGLRPGVLIAAPASMGRARAVQFAKAGYVALSVTSTGRDPQRLEAALEALAKQTIIAPHKIAGVGYGVGGSAMLDLARGGADMLGVAALHCDLTPPKKADAGKIAMRVLVLSGSDDPNHALPKVAAFETEMKSAQADWDMVRYGAVAGDFADPQAKTYDADADVRSQAAIRQFLVELFPPPRSFGGAAPPKPAAPPGIPAKALKVLQHIDEHDRAPDGYEGGRTFGNFERRLAATDRAGRRIRYHEWDVNPLRPGVNRGPERLVTGSDGTAYFTDDHYSTFKKIR